MPRMLSLITALLLVCIATTAKPVPPDNTVWTGTTEQKIWGLMTVYSEAKYTFPHFDRMPELDWDATVQAYIPKVIAAADMDSYYKVLFELVALLKDGHTSVERPEGRLIPGWDLAPIEVRILDDHFYVDRVGDAAELADQGICPGVEILDFNGQPADEYFAENVLRYHSDGSKHADEASLSLYLTYGPASEPMTMKIQDLNDVQRNVSVARNALFGESPFATRLIENALFATTIRTRPLAGGILYVDIPNFQHDQVREDFLALIDELDASAIKGMIIDLRYNSGGGSRVQEPMVSCLIDQPVKSPIFKFRHFIGAHVAWGREPTWETTWNEIQPRDGKRYLGPLVVLTGGVSCSGAEDFIIEVYAGGRATLVGQTTAGGAGNGLWSTLPGGGKLRIATFTALIPDGGEYVGVGIAPDVEVWPTRKNLAEGRDVVLERALELLQD
jgi:Peptidase family S41